MQSLLEVLNDNINKFAFVIPQLRSSIRLLPISFGADNFELAHVNYNNIEQFSKYITNKLDNHKKLCAFGGYLEDREMYKRFKLFKSGGDIRTVHLGIDLWTSAGTPVMAFYDGFIHSFGINNNHGDFGGIIILKHELQNYTFYTLYGHLSHQSVKDKTKGQKIETGETFAFIGSPSENGYWPPHLHVQIITDLLKFDLDFPGTCSPKNIDYFRRICPNPAVVLKLSNI